MQCRTGAKSYVDVLLNILGFLVAFQFSLNQEVVSLRQAKISLL